MRVVAILLITLFVLCQTAYAQDGLAGHWDFNDPQNPGKALVGNDLIQQGNGVAVVEGPAQDNGAVTVGTGSYFIVTHNTSPNGGGNKVNEFSIVMDVRLPEPNEWYAFYQTDITNTNDADWFINKNGNMGVGATGYTTYKYDQTGDWYRIAISVKNGSQYNYYSDGVRRLTGTPGTVDGRFSLSETFLLFADQNGEDNPIDVADIKLFSRALDDAEIAALGGYKHDGLPPAPIDSVINPYLQTPTSTSIYISWNASPGRESVVEYGTDSSLGNSATGTVYIFEDSTRWWHTVKLSGLTPQTTYYYKAKTDSFESKIYKFRTQPVKGNTTGHIRFAVLGDNRTNHARFSEVVDSMKSTFIRLYGPNIENNINLLINVGDIVTDGNVLPQYKKEFFDPLKSISANIPTMISIGNHENEADNYYHYMKYEDFGGTQGEKYYSFVIGRVLFIAINSNRQLRNDTQIDWLNNVLTQAQDDSEIDWIFSFCHHPGHSEYWPDGNTDYVQSRVIPTLKKYSKAEILFYGHSHDYERGALQDGNLRLMLSGGGGGGLDRWQRYDNQRDYPEIQKVFDHYCYSIIDVDVENKQYSATTYSLGHPDRKLKNEIIDSFYRDKNASPPPKPELEYPQTGAKVDIPFTLIARDYSNTYEIMSSQFQVTASPGEYNNLIINKIRDFENIFGDKGTIYYYRPVDLNEDIDLSELSVRQNGLAEGKSYWWRMRYRDKNLQWSEWSDERCFIAGVTDIGKSLTQLPLKTKLFKNYPNPFNSITVIRFSLEKPGFTSLKIYSISGRIIKTLVNNMMPSGTFSVRWDGKDENNVTVSSGTYFYKIETPDYVKTQKALLMK